MSQAITLRLVETGLESVIPHDLYDRLKPLFIKSHLVTGLSQLEDFVEIVSYEAGASESAQIKRFGTIKTSIAPIPPLQRLIMMLRVKQMQIKSSTKKANDKSSKLVAQDSFYKIDEIDQAVIKDLKDSLLASDLQSMANLLDD